MNTHSGKTVRLLVLAWLLGIGAFIQNHSAQAVSKTEQALLPIPAPDLTRLEPAVRKQLRAARAELSAIIANPEVTKHILSESYGEMGRLYHAHHLYDPAEACYHNAQYLAPNIFHWPYLLGYLYQQQALLKQAAASYQRALHIRLSYAPAQLRLGQVYIGLNQLDRAVPLLRAALTVADQQGAAAFELGKVALEQGKLNEAVEWFQQALAADPRASRINYPLAMAYRGLGDIDRARHHLKQRGDIEPEIPDPVIAELEQLLRGARTHQYRAMKAVWARQFDVAAVEFRKIVALEPDNQEARVSLARALYMMGNRDGAREQLRIALNLQSGHDQANYFMGRLVQEMGSDQAAMDHYRATLAANPEHAGAHFFLANALMRKGARAQAAEHYAKVVELLPENQGARLLEIMALIGTGRHQEAQERLQKALQMQPADPTLSRALARLLAASPDDAVRDGTRALALGQTLFNQVNSIENAETLAMAYAEIGRYDAAAAFQQAAIDAAMQLGGFNLIPALSINLTLYQQGKPCRAPWPDDAAVFYPNPLNYGESGLAFSGERSH